MYMKLACTHVFLLAPSWTKGTVNWVWNITGPRSEWGSNLSWWNDQMAVTFCLGVFRRVSLRVWRTYCRVTVAWCWSVCSSIRQRTLTRERKYVPGCENCVNSKQVRACVRRQSSVSRRVAQRLYTYLHLLIYISRICNTCTVHIYWLLCKILLMISTLTSSILILYVHVFMCVHVCVCAVKRNPP